MSFTPDPVDPEKAAGLTFSSSSPTGGGTPNGHHNYGHRAKDHMRHFLHPAGKRIHVAASPSEAIRLRDKLSLLHQPHEFEIYVSGTPEHIAAVREARTHHEERRDELRSQHGAIYDRFADVHAELDLLSHELERVTTNGVSLEAHFSRFGYNAHIKSYDDETPEHSGATTPRGSISSASGADLGYIAPLKLFKTPVVRQYFHKGILWRGSCSEEVQTFELFVDLLYVGIIAINGDAASEHPTGSSLLQFIITFTLSWKIWNDMALIISWFETDDIFQRVSILFLLACLFGYTTNIMEAFEHTYATLIGFYLAARLYMSAYLAAIAFILPMIRPIMIWNVAVVIISSAFWIGSIHVEYPENLSLIWIAIAVDIIGPIMYVFLQMACYRIGQKTKDWFDGIFQFYPAINIEHRTERMNAFVTLVFGYTVVAILYQSTRNGIDAHFGKAILGLVQAFCFNWLYFEVDGRNLNVHAIRRHKVSSMTWNMAHLPFIMSFVLAGGALARLVIATDTRNSGLEYLTDTYQARSEHEITKGIRWFYCAGLGVALACMGCISISHVHKDIPTLRFKKKHRLVGRFCIAIVLICLPLAESLDSLQLVGTVSALIAFVLMSELWASSCCNEKLFSRSRPCAYTGMCGKKQLKAFVEQGKEVDVEQLLKGGRNTGDGVVVGP